VRSAAYLAALGLALAVVVPHAATAQGSNLGSYGKQFVPGSIVGKVAVGGIPVAGARVETSAGQFATTDAGGNYVLYVDAAGIYDVSVSSGSRRAGPVQVVVTLGAATTRDFDRLYVVQPRRLLPKHPAT